MSGCKKLDANGKIMEEAALRIAAVEKTHFEVVQYYEKERVLKEQDLIYKVFPKEVADKIMEHVERSE